MKKRSNAWLSWLAFVVIVGLDGFPQVVFSEEGPTRHRHEDSADHRHDDDDEPRKKKARVSPQEAVPEGDEHKESGEHGEEHEEHGEHEEETGPRVGPGKAIQAASKENGIQLSEAAAKAIGLKSGPIRPQSSATFGVSPKSLVYFQDEVGVYRLRDGWYRLVEVEILEKTPSGATIRTSDLKVGDQIATEGVALLRVAELEAWGGSGDGHGH